MVLCYEDNWRNGWGWKTQREDDKTGYCFQRKECFLHRYPNLKTIIFPNTTETVIIWCKRARDATISKWNSNSPTDLTHPDTKETSDSSSIFFEKRSSAAPDRCFFATDQPCFHSTDTKNPLSMPDYHPRGVSDTWHQLPEILQRLDLLIEW